MDNRDIDQRDTEILRELSRNGRISNAALARSVGLSESATLERVRRLEASGVIRGYTARVSPGSVGRGLEAIIAIQLSHHHEEDVERFKASLLEMDEVLSCFAVAGRYDFIAHVAVHNMEDFERVVARRLMRLRAIDRIETLFVLNALKRDAALLPFEPVRSATDGAEPPASRSPAE
jgi:DNA-binding Lrp family transcriptional regulator